MKIRTVFVYPPIPIRNFDWQAIDDDRYDGEGCPIGTGSTEKEAIDDLLSKVCMYHGAHTDVPDCGYCGVAVGSKCPAIIIGQTVEPPK